MEGYSYSYPTSYPMMPMRSTFPDHGDGFGDYYDEGATGSGEGRSRSKLRTRRSKTSRRSRSRSGSPTPRLKSRSRSRSKSQSKSRSRSRSRSACKRDLNYREPSFLDAFRVLYLTPSKHKSALKYLSTQKRQSRLHDILKSDGLGSKRWLFYPRLKNTESRDTAPETRDNVDQRIKIDGDFFRKYKRSKKIAEDAPIGKLKRWELILYKKMGFVQAI